MMTQPVLYALCGKIASGKSTLAAALKRQSGAILLSEDAMLHALFGAEMQSIADYVDRTARLREVVDPLCTDLLQAGNSVILDFAANRPQERGWMLRLAQKAGARMQLHHMQADDDACLARLRARNAKGAHPFEVSEAQFRQVTAHFVPPSPDEGFAIIEHRG